MNRWMKGILTAVLSAAAVVVFCMAAADGLDLPGKENYK